MNAKHAGIRVHVWVTWLCVIFAGNAMGACLLPGLQVVTKADIRWKNRALIEIDDHFCRHARKMHRKWTKLEVRRCSLFWKKTLLFLLFGDLGMMTDKEWHHLCKRCQMWGIRGEQEGKKQRGNKFQQMIEEKGNWAKGERVERRAWRKSETSRDMAHACFVYGPISRYSPCPEKKKKHQKPASGQLIRFQSNQTFMEFWVAQKVKWNRWMEKVEPKGLRLWLVAGTVT